MKRPRKRFYVKYQTYRITNGKKYVGGWVWYYEDKVSVLTPAVIERMKKFIDNKFESDYLRVEIINVI